MSAHVKVWRTRHLWMWGCRGCKAPVRLRYGSKRTHAEALAAAWAHIKEHS